MVGSTKAEEDRLLERIGDTLLKEKGFQKLSFLFLLF
jgi:hypothetical protein